MIHHFLVYISIATGEDRKFSTAHRSIAGNWTQRTQTSSGETVTKKMITLNALQFVPILPFHPQSNHLSQDLLGLHTILSQSLVLG